uniref:Prominin-1-A n=1 Tax=Oryzias latipes TaxID=8090 RepID=A0A3P9LNM6_ORYLA
MENCWRWGSAGGFRSVMGLMGVELLVIFQIVHSQPTCPAAPAQENLTQPQYEAATQKDPSVGFMAPFSQSFLNTVQPNPFPADLIQQIVQGGGNVISQQELINKVLVYQVGFLVCIAIGILYIVLMPIIGLFLACCRCCGNCGGEMYQKQTSSIHCRRRTLYVFAWATTLIILAGNICMFSSNAALKVSVERSPAELNRAIRNIQTFLKSVPQQMDSVLNESYKTIQGVSNNLDDIGPQLGSEIQQRFNGTLDSALNSVRHLGEENSDIGVQLIQLNISIIQLQSTMDRLQANITKVQKQIDQTLSNPNCTNCSAFSSEVQNPKWDSSVTIPNLQELRSAVDEAKTNLQNKIQEGETYFKNIPGKVANDTKGFVKDGKVLLDNVKAQISQLSIPDSALSQISVTLNETQTQIDTFSPTVKYAEYIRWSVCTALCCAVLLVVVCNFLGLIFGPLGLSPKVDPTMRSGTANCGGTFLMMGAGFSFLFSWLLMIVVLLLFVLGGNLYTLVCQPWNNGQLLEFINSSRVFPELDLGPALGLKDSLGVSAIYRDCNQNRPLWTTLHLHEVVDLGNLLNVSKYTTEIQQKFDNTHINMTTINLLSPEITSQLRSLSKKTVNTTTLTQQMNNVSSINLNSTADGFMGLADNQKNRNIQTELRNEANQLKQIQADIETVLIPQMKNLNSTLRSLQSSLATVNGTVEEVLRKVGAAQDFLNTNASQIIKTESRKFLDCQLNIFLLYADWANFTITRQLGRCGPVAGAVDSAEVILCAYTVESLNAFWLSLGWCVIFFIPGIIFSIKLAKYYRKMKDSDVYDDHIVMHQIPRATARFLPSAQLSKKA